MEAEAPKTLEEIRDFVIEAGGVLTLDMATVRNAYPADRLGAQIRQNIHDQLRGLGIGHVGDELPDKHWYPVRLFHIGSPAGKLIEAVGEPGPAGDEQILEMAARDETAKLARIREIVCD